MTTRSTPGPSSLPPLTSPPPRPSSTVTSTPWTTSPAQSYRGDPRAFRAGSVMSTYSDGPSLPPGMPPGLAALGQGFPPRRQAPDLRKFSSNSGYSVATPGGAGGGGGAASTPDYKKRAAKMAAKMAERGITLEADRDWANVEPDEVFRRLPVGEVRRVEGKMRKEAEEKQSELRTMVGARYRDLLTSATQISTLRSSSIHLSSSLRTVAAACANPDDIAITAETSTQVSDNEEDVMKMLPVAAHVKLLLDAPEALYGYLSEGEVLKAAWLWLVARVVREGMSNLGDQSEVYHPLLQRQWEILLPFRAQITQRATEQLRSKEALDTKQLSESLLTVILLDNVAVPETLSLLLSQRVQTLREILTHPSPPSARARRFSTSSHRHRRRTLSKSVHPIAEQESIGGVLSGAISCLLETVASARAVFDKSTPERKGESLMEEMIRLVQIGETAPQTVTQPTPIRRMSSSSSNHVRRASRLVSLSLPVAVTSGTASGKSPVSTPQIIQSLPSSQILLRHLPQSVLAFTPFITPPQPPGLDDKLEAFYTEALRLLTESAPAWLADLHSVQSVWLVRKRVLGELGEEPQGARVREALESQWRERIRGVWEMKMHEIVDTLSDDVRKATEEIRRHPKEADINPERFVFSDISFPSAPSSTLSTVMPTSVTAFAANLKRRNIYRTPLLDRVLSQLEHLAKAVRSDVNDLPPDLVRVYEDIAGRGLKDLLQVLDDAVVSGNDVTEDHAEQVQENVHAELLVGRIALFLARYSTFISDLTAGSALETASALESLIGIHSRSTESWQSSSVTRAMAPLSAQFEPLPTASEIAASWQHPFPLSPSATMMTSLTSLVKSTRSLGIPAGADLPVTRDLVREYVRQVGQLPGWSELADEKRVQAAVDLGLLALLDGRSVEEDSLASSMLDKLPESIPSDFPSLLPQILHEHLRRTQILLHPLIAHLPPSLPGSLAAEASAADTVGGRGRFGADSRAQMLRFGPPSGKVFVSALPGGAADSSGVAGEDKAGTVSEFRSPIAVMKPGKRFGLVN